MRKIRASIWRCTFANTEKKVSCGGNSEISSAGKETTLNTLIITASLQTRPSCVGAVMDTSDHYTDACFSVPRVSLGASKSRACLQSSPASISLESHTYYYLIAKPRLAKDILDLSHHAMPFDLDSQIEWSESIRSDGLEQRERMKKHLRTSSSSDTAFTRFSQ
ncbi:hypothetical protein HN011_004958 [Eciton burchellii]|nr:hypothetical protein HN011_004958 [Eciton burchellii]